MKCPDMHRNVMFPTHPIGVGEGVKFPIIIICTEKSCLQTSTSWGGVEGGGQLANKMSLGGGLENMISVLICKFHSITGRTSFGY